MSKQHVISKVLATLRDQNKEVDRICMSHASKISFSTGEEPVEILIKDDLPYGKFVYLRPGEEYSPDNFISHWANVGELDIFSEPLCSSKRVDWPGV